MKSCIYLDTSTENRFQHSEKMNIHLKCPEAPEVFLPKITTLKMKWMILVSLHCGFCLHFSSQRWNSRWGSQSYYILRLCCCTGGYKGLLHHLFLIINHQNTPVISHEPLDPLPSTTHQTWGKNGTETLGIFNVCQGARALDIRESGYALTEHMLDLMKCTSNSRVPLGAPGRKKSEMFLFNKTPPKKQPRLEENNMSLYHYHLLLWLCIISIFILIF